MGIWDLPGRLLVLARDVGGMLDLQHKMQATLDDVDGPLRAVEDRMTRLEAGQGQIITEARAAAGAAATGLAGSVIAEVVTRMTRVEMRHDDMHRRLPPPGQ